MKMLNKLVSSIGELFFDFQSKLQFFEREFLRENGIEDVTPTEVKVLYMVGLSNTKSMSEIASKLKVTKSTLSIAINSLVKKGYVIRTRHKQDRRVIIVYLTDKSIQAVKLYGKFYFELLKSLIKVIENEKVEVLREILMKLNMILEINDNNLNEEAILDLVNDINYENDEF